MLMHIVTSNIWVQLLLVVLFGASAFIYIKKGKRKHWSHQIRITRLEKGVAGQYYPYCNNGAMNCPPEDCGGIRSFYSLLEILQNKAHPEYAEVKRWFKRGYAVEKFDARSVNMKLLKLDSYINKWIRGR